jgi:hypothetical protein
MSEQKIVYTADGKWRFEAADFAAAFHDRWPGAEVKVHRSGPWLVTWDNGLWQEGGSLSADGTTFFLGSYWKPVVEFVVWLRRRYPEPDLRIASVDGSDMIPVLATTTAEDLLSRVGEGRRALQSLQGLREAIRNRLLPMLGAQGFFVLRDVLEVQRGVRLDILARREVVGRYADVTFSGRCWAEDLHLTVHLRVYEVAGPRRTDLWGKYLGPRGLSGEGQWDFRVDGPQDDTFNKIERDLWTVGLPEIGRQAQEPPRCQTGGSVEYKMTQLLRNFGISLPNTAEPLQVRAG